MAYFFATFLLLFLRNTLSRTCEDYEKSYFLFMTLSYSQDSPFGYKVGRCCLRRLRTRRSYTANRMTQRQYGSYITETLRKSQDLLVSSSRKENLRIVLRDDNMHILEENVFKNILITLPCCWTSCN